MVTTIMMTTDNDVTTSSSKNFINNLDFIFSIIFYRLSNTPLYFERSGDFHLQGT
jgi:hypothetical protein